MRVTLRQLQVFDAIARHGGIARAAEDLALSDSAVSDALKQLESALETQLFERNKRHMVLNTNGYRLRPAARAILNQVSDLEGRTRPKELSGTLRIASGSTAGAYVMPEICSRFMAENPKVLIDHTVCTSTEVVARVHDLRQDLGFPDGKIVHPKLQVIPWLEDDLTVFCAPCHRFANRIVDAAELVSERWVFQPFQSFTRSVMWYHYNKFAAEAEIVMESNNIDFIKRSVQLGAGIGCLSKFSLKREFSEGALAPIGLKSSPLTRNLCVALRRDMHHTDLTMAFLNCAQKLAFEGLRDTGNLNAFLDHERKPQGRGVEFASLLSAK